MGGGGAVGVVPALLETVGGDDQPGRSGDREVDGRLVVGPVVARPPEAGAERLGKGADEGGAVSLPAPVDAHASVAGAAAVGHLEHHLFADRERSGEGDGEQVFGVLENEAQGGVVDQSPVLEQSHREHAEARCCVERDSLEVVFGGGEADVHRAGGDLAPGVEKEADVVLEHVDWGRRRVRGPALFDLEASGLRLLKAGDFGLGLGVVMWGRGQRPPRRRQVHRLRQGRHSRDRKQRRKERVTIFCRTFFLRARQGTGDDARPGADVECNLAVISKHIASFVLSVTRVTPWNRLKKGSGS